MTILISVMILMVIIVLIYHVRKKQAKKSEYDYIETYSLPSNPNAMDSIVATPNNPAYGVCPNTGTDVTAPNNPAYSNIGTEY